MWGADNSTATVAMMVNMVKMMRQNRSTTIAANFQSLITSASSSAFFMRFVINCNSRRIFCRSRCVPELGIAASSIVVGCRMNPLPRLVVMDELLPPPVTFRKSSSMSSTFASKLFEERSFSSSSFMRLFIKIVLRVIFFPGRLIPRIHGSHCRNTDLIWKKVQHTEIRKLLARRLPTNAHPLRHLVDVGGAVVVVEYHYREYHGGSHHEHNAVEVSACNVWKVRACPESPPKQTTTSTLRQYKLQHTEWNQNSTDTFVESSSTNTPLSESLVLHTRYDQFQTNATRKQFSMYVR